MKIFKGLLVLCFVFIATGLFAINNNQSVEYTRTFNRNASTDVDASFFNPAGLAFLKKNGLHVQVANQFIFQTKTIEEDSALINAYGRDEYKGDIQALVYPDLHVVYKMDKLALYLNMMPIAGGGGGTYENGLPMFDNLLFGFVYGVAGSVLPSFGGGTPTITSYSSDLNFEGLEFTIGTTVGGAYKINERFSVALGYRLLYVINSYAGYAKDLTSTVSVSGSGDDATAAATIDSQIVANWEDVEVDTTATGIGHAVVLGFDARPNDKLNVGFRFTYNFKMQSENDTSTFEGPALLLGALGDYADGAKKNVTEPILFALGVSYNVTKELRVEVSANYTLDDRVNRTDNSTEESFKNKILAGITVEYAVMSDLKASIGYLYDSGHRNDRARTETVFNQEIQYIAFGAGYDVNETVNIGLGVYIGMYSDAGGVGKAPVGKTSEVDQSVYHTNLGFGIGVNLKL